MQTSNVNPTKEQPPVNTDFKAGGEEERWPEDQEAPDTKQEFNQEEMIEREREVQEAEDEDIVEDDRPGQVIHNAAGASPEDNLEMEDEEEDLDEEENEMSEDLGDEDDDRAY